MPKPLEEEEIQEILDAYREYGSINKAAENIEYSRDSVIKYVNERIKDDDDDESEGADGPGEEQVSFEERGGQQDAANPREANAPQLGQMERPSDVEGFTAEPPEETGMTTGDPAEAGEDDDEPDFAEMAYDEFIEWFFSHSGFGVKEKFAKNLAQQCKIRKELPDQAAMSYMIQAHNSGIGNSNDANMIAENYWAAAQRYLMARGQHSAQPEPPQGGWMSGQPGPQPGMNQNGQANQQDQQGRWISGPPGQQGYYPNSQQAQPQQQNQQQPPQQQGPPQVGPASGQAHQRPQHQQAQYQPPQQGQPQQSQPNQQNHQQQGGMDEATRQQLEELQQTQAALFETVSELASEDTNESLTDTLEEVKAVEQTLEELRGEGHDEAIAELQRQNEQLREELAQQMEGDQQQVAQAGDDSIATLANLAAEGDLDESQLSVLADTMGVTDPDVKKAEYDLKKTEVKTESRKELVDRIFQNLESVSANAESVGKLISGLLNGFSQGPQGGQQRRQPQRQPQRRQPQRRQPQQQPQGQPPQDQRAAHQQQGQPNEHQQPARPRGERPPRQQEQPPGQQEQPRQAEQAPPEQQARQPTGHTETTGQEMQSPTRERFEQQVEANEQPSEGEDEPDAAAETQSDGESTRETPADEDTTEVRHTPKEAANNFDTTSWNDFQSDCIPYYDGDMEPCRELWNAITEAGLDQ